MGSWLETFSNDKTWSADCPICHGSQFLEDRQDRKSKVWVDSSDSRCPCWINYTTMARLWDQGFPRGYLKFNWDGSYPLAPDGSQRWSEWEHWKCQDSYIWQFNESDEQAVRYWVDNPDEVDRRGLSIVLYGAKGTGKTSLATTLAKELTKRKGVDASGSNEKFIPRFMVCDELYESLSSKDWKLRESSKQAMQAQVLVLDDLRLNYTGYVQVEYAERMHSFLQYRSGSNMPTIITANKLGTTQDHGSNCVTDFLGIQNNEYPERFGKFRFIGLTNSPLRPDPEWSL